MANKSEAPCASSIGWLRLLDLIHLDGDSKLLGALFTTYDDPDADLLAEDLLPRLLRVDLPTPTSPGERLLPLAELAEKIGGYRGQRPGISLFCTRRSSEPGQHWLWRTIPRYSPNRTRSCVQHAKLWLIHRAADRGELLDIVVSSANLTRSGLNGQIQAGWHQRIPLLTRSRANERGWSTLAQFLGALGEASGDAATAVCAHWQDLLPRAACPPGVRFVASVPGDHEPGKAWGLNGLPKRRKGGGLRVFVPTVGDWCEKSLVAFAAAAGVETKALELLWVRQGHPWAQHWAVDSSTMKVLQQSPINLRVLSVNPEGPPSRVHESHLQNDGRWSHAKLYGWDDALLITSASFSPAAWGRPIKGGIRIENFELGVRIDGAGWPTELAGEQPSRRAPAWATTESDREGGEPTEFLDATWDGDTIQVTWRPLNPPPRLPKTVSVDFEDIRASKSMDAGWRKAGDTLNGKVSCNVDTRPISIVGRGDGTVVLFSVPIIDTRPSRAGVPPVVPDELAGQDLDSLRLGVLEERYGGVIAKASPTCSKKKEKRSPSDDQSPSSAGASYAVDWHAQARQRWIVLDNWAETLERTLPAAKSFVIADGKRLLVLWKARLNVIGEDSVDAPGLRVMIREMEARCRWLSGNEEVRRDD